VQVHRHHFVASLVLAALLVVPAAWAAPGARVLLRGVESIATGSYHSCAIRHDGQVTCWGANDYGQFASPAGADQEHAVPLPGSLPDVLATTGGFGFHCLLNAAGTVSCAGRNLARTLGDGTTTSRAAFAPVQGLPGPVAQVDAGGTHVCAVVGGAAWCWGDNTDGKLGDGTNQPRATPVPVSGLGTGIAKVVAGEFFSCALDTTGAVFCWGNNQLGSLGDGTGKGSTVPVAVSGLSSGVIDVDAGGYHACALTSEGQVRCWGMDIGLAPVTVALDVPAVQVATGFDHTCVRDRNFGVACVGRNNLGQLGDGPGPDSGMFVRPQNIVGGVTDLAAGGDHTCARLHSGRVMCWGYNGRGEVGNAAIGNSQATPVYVLESGSVRQGVRCDPDYVFSEGMENEELSLELAGNYTWSCAGGGTQVVRMTLQTDRGSVTGTVEYEGATSVVTGSRLCNARLGLSGAVQGGPIADRRGDIYYLNWAASGAMAANDLVLTRFGDEFRGVTSNGDSNVGMFNGCSEDHGPAGRMELSPSG